MKPKNKPVILTEQEQFFAAKNRRRQWWKDNGEKFIRYPIIVLAICAVVAAVWTALSIGVVMTVLNIDKDDVTIKLGIDPDNTATKQELLGIQMQVGNFQQQTIQLSSILSGERELVADLQRDSIQQENAIDDLKQAMAGLDAQLNPPKTNWSANGLIDVFSTENITATITASNTFTPMTNDWHVMGHTKNKAWRKQ